MEQSMPVIGKKSWNLVRAVFYMLRKGIAKGKLMADLNIMLKRGKIAGKAFQNLMFHHHYAWSISAALNHRHSKTLPVDRSPPPGEYEFSCSNSPTSIFSFPKKQNNNHHSHFFSCVHAPQTNEEENTVSVNAAAVMKALEILHSHNESASPALPGFGKTPTVRQLRVTDSPFPLQAVDEDSHVDEAAEEFIMKFYRELKRQKNKSLDLSLR